MTNIPQYIVFDKVNRSIITTNLGITHCTSFSKWNNMTTRVYRYCDSNKNKDTYFDVEIGDNFLNFDFFKGWCEKEDFSNYYVGDVPYSLDKDLLSNGKLYSEDTCVFIPSWLNFLIPTTNTKFDKKLMYSSLSKKCGVNPKYTAFLKMKEGNSKFVGGFIDRFDANKFSISVKCATMKRLSKELDGFVSEKVIDVLSNFDKWLLDNGFCFDENFDHPKLNSTIKWYTEYYLDICEEAKKITVKVDHKTNCEYCNDLENKLKRLYEIGVNVGGGNVKT